MSFTVAVKEEILRRHHLSRHELSAIIKMSGSIGLSSSGLTLSVITENVWEHRVVFFRINFIGYNRES